MFFSGEGIQNVKTSSAILDQINGPRCPSLHSGSSRWFRGRAYERGMSGVFHPCRALPGVWSRDVRAYIPGCSVYELLMIPSSTNLSNPFKNEVILPACLTSCGSQFHLLTTRCFKKSHILRLFKISLPSPGGLMAYMKYVVLTYW